MSHAEQRPSDDVQASLASQVLDREIAAEQAVVSRAYHELDSQLAQARRSLARTEAQGASGTHQARSERDAYASHYAQRVAALEGVEDRLVFGRMDMVPAADDGAAGPGPEDLPSAGPTGPRLDPGVMPGPDHGSPSGPEQSGPVAHAMPTRHYVGRIGLQDASRHEVVLDWRAPMARAFYQATAATPMGLVRRRHISTRARTVTGLEDELIDVTAASRTTVSGSTQVAADSLQGEGALFAAMSAAREGRMGDIVATIQAEQDRIVTSPGRGVLVVQGGPGTGKTAVALHRVAYLFYSERERLARTGVLLVGPSRTFLRYVEQVLPSLGETGVVSTTVGDLVPGIHARGPEDAAVAELKGRLVWADVLARAVRSLQRVPDAPRPVEVQGVTLHLTPADVREAMTRARRSARPHNLAREPFVLWLLERLTDQYAHATGADADDPDTRAWIREDVRTSRDARREINLCWMPTTPVDLLERLWARPALLESLAPELGRAERGLLVRPAGSPLTPSDVPLVDELAELLGPSDDAAARRARTEARRREAEVAYAAQAIEAQDLGGGMVTAEMLADRFADTGPSLTLAERARADRSWTYGHVVVDEAQELGPMAWRALARRCPVRSFTVVGDLDQYSGPTAPASWEQVLGPVAGPARTPQDGPRGTRAGTGAREGTGRGTEGRPGAPRGRAAAGVAGSRAAASPEHLREEVLTVCYRTPATVMAAAEAVLAGLGHKVDYPVRSVRDLPDCLEVTDLSGTATTGTRTAGRAGGADGTTATGATATGTADRAAADQVAADELSWADALQEAVTQEVARLDAEVGPGAGRVAVIAPGAPAVAAALGQDPALAAAMEAPEDDVLRARVAVMGPVASKGLEYDTVVLVDPVALGAVSPGDLYVAMTRPTRRLRVVSRLPLPVGLT